MNRIRLLLIALVCALPIVLGAMQAEMGRRLEITGVNATNLPTLTITANVYDPLGLPVRGLTIADFLVDADFGFPARIVRVQNITAEEVPFAAVLVIDVSDSMFGFPLERAREAAAAFVDIVNESDPIALIAFATRVELLQDFTTNSDLLRQAINSLTTSGQTALYQAAYEGIDLAAGAPEPRRVMILLSDGAEFGGHSRVTPQEVFQHALERGVTVYTIGLGFGADRSFLERLADVTFGRFYESPTPNELVRIYTELAETLRSQYVITLEVEVPLDGTEYALGLGLRGDDAAAVTSFRAPIPIPIVRLPEFPEAEIAAPLSLEFAVLADERLTDVTAVVTDAAGVVVAEAGLDPARPQYLIDPEQFLPGRYDLTVTAVDADGDRGSAAAEFFVAALPSTITIDPDLAALGALREPVQVQIGAVGQTPIASAEFRVDGPDFPEGAFFPLDLGEGLVLLPQILSAGPNRLTVRAVNEAGVTSTAEFPFTVAALPPRVTVAGIVDGQRIETPTRVVAGAIGQTETFAFTARAGQTTLPVVEGVFEIDPQALPPGPLRVSISATDANGQTGTIAVDVEIAALPPIITVEGLQRGETISEDREVRLAIESQTPISSVQILVDDGEVEVQRRPPFGTTLRVLELLTGSHTLTITAENEAGQRQTLTLNFTVAESVALTATALAPTPTFTATFTPSPSPTISPTPTPTIDRDATGTAQAAIELEITQAAETRSAQLMATADAATRIFELTQVAAEIGTAVRLLETAGAQTQAAAQNATQVAAVIQTQAAGLTQTVEAREAEQILIAEQTAAAGLAQTATATAVEATQVAATATAVQVTREAVIAGQTATAVEATQVALTAAAAQTEAAALTQAAEVRAATATATAVEATQVALTAAAQTETAVLRQTIEIATATAEAALTATAAQQATNIAQANATATELAGLLLTATANAQATATRAALETAVSIAQATFDAAATATAEAVSLATATAEAEAQMQALMVATETQAAEETAAAGVTAIAQVNIEQTETAAAIVSGTETAAAQAEAARAAQVERTATAAAQATQAAQAALASPTLTPTEVTAVAQAEQTAVPTVTPTLTLVEAESPPVLGALSPAALIVGGVLLVVLLIIIALLLLARRRRQR